MSQQIVSTWDGVANTNSWVHDGDVERSAVDIVELASSVAGYSAGAQAAADAASGYADTASAAVASIGTAATDAVAAVQDEGAAQISALVDAGGVQSALIGSAGAAQIADIVTSGGVVTSAIADAGSAEIADIVSAGGAQVALVSAAGTSATGDLAAVTAAQSAALVSAGGYQAGLVASAGTATIALVQAEGATQTAAISASVASQVNIATSAAIVATSAATVASSTVSALTSAGSAQIALVNSAGAAQSAALVSAGGVQVSLVESAGATQSSLVVSTGAAQSAIVVSTGATQSAVVTSAGGAQTTAITSAGAVQSAAVVSAGTAQIALVQSAGAAEVQAIEDAGEVYQAQIDDNAQRIENINEYAEGQLFSYETDSTEAYVKSVPAGVVQNAEVRSIAGKTIVWNQLADYHTDSMVVNGITWTKNSDNSYTATGTATADSFIDVSQTLTGRGNHKMFIAGCPAGGGNNQYMIFDGYTNYTLSADYGSGRIYSVTSSSGYAICRLYVWSGATVNVTFKPRFTDLTLLYGAGNEPTTVEQFRAEFPADYYAYNAGTLLSAGVTDAKSVGRNLLRGTNSNIAENGVAISYNEETHEYTANGTATGSYAEIKFTLDAPLAIASNTSITMSMYSASPYGFTVYGYDIKSSSYASFGTMTVGSGKASLTYTPSMGREISFFFIRIAQNTTINSTFTIQLERGSVSTSYSPPFTATLSIPASVQSLPGYGWSAGSAKNVLDLENGKYIQNVGSVDLGTLNYNVYDSSGFVFAYGKTVLSNVKIPVGGDDVANVICAKYVAASYNGCIGGHVDKQIGIIFSTSSLAGKIFLSDSAYTTAADLKAALSGVMLYYELATPVITDISELLTPGSYLAVEVGGTITFQNSNGSDYRIPVASSVRYQEAVDLAGRVADAEDAIAQNTEDIATNTADIAANAASIAALDTKTDITDKNVDNVLALLNGALSAEQIDSAAAYQKAVPAKAQPWAGMQEVGGRTVVWNQLMPILTASQTKTTNGVTLTDNRDGTYTISTDANGATADTGIIFTTTVANFQTGHKYIYTGAPSGGTISTYYSYIVNNSVIPVRRDYGMGGVLLEATGSGAVYNVFFVASGTVITTPLVYTPQIFDITLMLGSTEADYIASLENDTPYSGMAYFRKMFPASYYAYDAGSLKSAGVTGVVSVGKNILPLPANMAPITNYGVTITPNPDGSYTFNGTPTRGSFTTIPLAHSFTLPPDQSMYLHMRNNTASSNFVVIVAYRQNGTAYDPIASVTNRITQLPVPYQTVSEITFYWNSSQTAFSNFVLRPSIEATSATTDFAPYMTQTLPIPSAVQQLPGYGWSAGTAYNYIDWQRKVYIQRVGKIHLPDLTWAMNTAHVFVASVAAYFDSVYADISNVLLCSRYLKGNAQDIYAGTADKQFAMNTPYLGKSIAVCDTAYSTKDAFVASLTDVDVFYPMLTPVETDISAYLTDDNLLAVEPGGTLTFPNSLGDDYRIPVPSTEEFTIDLAPDTPTTDGTYTLQCTVADGVPTYEWVSA